MLGFAMSMPTKAFRPDYGLMKANPIIPELPSVATIGNDARAAVGVIEATGVLSVGRGIEKLADTFSTAPNQGPLPQGSNTAKKVKAPSNNMAMNFTPMSGM